jgi:hypothetical protein
MSRPTPTAALLVAFVLAWTAAAAGADRTLTAAGTIVKVDAKARTVVVAVADGPETTFLWTDETKIAGTLAPGARVTLRYTSGSDRKNVALQITVSRS